MSITGVIKIKRCLSQTAPYLSHISQVYRAEIAQSASWLCCELEGRGIVGRFQAGISDFSLICKTCRVIGIASASLPLSSRTERFGGEGEWRYSSTHTCAFVVCMGQLSFALKPELQNFEYKEEVNMFCALSAGHWHHTTSTRSRTETTSAPSLKTTACTSAPTCRTT